MKSAFSHFTDETPAEDVMALLKAANVTTEPGDFFPRFDPVHGTLACEGIRRRGDLVIVKPFGDEWLPVLHVLGRSDILCFWGRLWHEHGVDYYISRTTGEFIFSEVDEQDGELDEGEFEALEARWFATIPTKLQRYFPDESDSD
ncbi:hypothetical protein [Allohahella sp. A8]|uniref:hypothetical protein n=1 Tax=Allohahella sp. A8 TaxID=3141461 RepID=UPI003A8104FC